MALDGGFLRDDRPAHYSLRREAGFLWAFLTEFLPMLAALLWRSRLPGVPPA